MSRAVSGIETYGSTIPYAEPPWARGLPSPYIRASHRQLQKAMRDWVETNIIPFVAEWEAPRSLPDGLYKACASAGILMRMAAGSRIPQQWAGKYPIIGQVDAADWDGFHDFILHDEMMRVGGIGPCAFRLSANMGGGKELKSMQTQYLHALPALTIFDGLIHDVLSGDTRFSLAVTEPEAGSDVQGVTTTDVLNAEETHYIINGQKKWITGGMYADYFLTLTRTSGDGFTLLAIPKDSTVTARGMEMCGSTGAGTAFIEFDDTPVPIANRVGVEGKGLAYVMSNFNHERLFISFQSLRCARMCLEDSIVYAPSML